MVTRIFSTLMLFVVLSACAITPAQRLDPSSIDKAPSSGQTRAAANLAALDGRTAVRNFLAVVQAVEPVAESVCRESGQQANCDFKIVVDDSPKSAPNAFQTLDEDGRPVIAFTVSLIAITQNRDELAFIMAHEAAHHIRGHLQQQQQHASLGAALAGAIFGGDQNAQQIGAALAARRFSKDFELEADALGTLITARSGFDPLVGAAFFDRIPDPGNRFLGTHPGNDQRRATVENVVRGL